MIDALLAWSVRQRVLVLVLTAVFVVVGAAAATRVPFDAVPDVTNVQVQVITAAPALGPIDVETYVTAVVEHSLAGVAGMEEVRSVSRAGISVVTAVFADGTDRLRARQLVGERVALAREEIPSSYGVPALGPMSSGLGEVYHFEVRGEGRSLMELRSVLDWQIAPRLRLVPGVVEVNTFGGEARTLEVTVDAERLSLAGVGVSDVVGAVRRNHIAVGGAYMVDGPEHVAVRGEARVRSADDLAAVRIESRSGAQVLVRDVASVRGAPRPRYGAVTRDARGEAVVGVALLAAEGNSATVVPAIKAALDAIGPSLPPGVTVDGYYDRTELVHRTVHTVATNLLESGALVILVLFLTLGSLRAGSLVALSIPLALLGVFLGMASLGVSGNLMSLGAIDFGLVVDGAIIIVENAQRRLAERRAHAGRALTDDERRDEVLTAAREVRGATAFGEAIIALVYVPLLALEGVEGRMFRPMAMTVLCALAAAFVLSLTLVPALASLVLSREPNDEDAPLVRAAHRVYRPLLTASLARPAAVFALAAVLGLAGISLGATLGRSFLPRLDEGTMVITMVRLPSVSLAQSTALTTQVERILRGFPEVRTVVSRTGRAEIAVDPMGVNMTDVYVMLKPRAEWRTAHDREGLLAAFDHALSTQVPGTGFAFTQPIEMNTNDLLAGIESDVALHIYGHDLGALRRLGERTVRILRSVPGAVDVRCEQVAGLEALTVQLDRTALARHGVDAEVALETVSAIGGIEVGTFLEEGRRVPIQVRLSERSRSSPEAIAALPVRTSGGAMVPLGQLGRVTVEPGPSQVSRAMLQRSVTVQLNVRGRDLASFVDAARVALARRLELPTGYTTAWAGEYERLESATLRLLVVIPVTLALILVLLIATFGRIRPALLIFLNVPLAVSGGVIALSLRGMELSISAAVGFIALFGVAVLNGLVLVASIERLRGEGATLLEAVRRGAEGRVRPVLTTAMVASLGFLPMALATGAGAEVQRPLATVVIGGIITSTLLTLLVLPAAFLRAPGLSPPMHAPTTPH